MMATVWARQIMMTALHQVRPVATIELPSVHVEGPKPSENQKAVKVKAVHVLSEGLVGSKSLITCEKNVRSHCFKNIDLTDFEDHRLLMVLGCMARPVFARKVCILVYMTLLEDG